jgi:hypothetical protein
MKRTGACTRGFAVALLEGLTQLGSKFLQENTRGIQFLDAAAKRPDSQFPNENG